MAVRRWSTGFVVAAMLVLPAVPAGATTVTSTVPSNSTAPSKSTVPSRSTVPSNSTAPSKSSDVVRIVSSPAAGPSIAAPGTVSEKRATSGRRSFRLPPETLRVHDASAAGNPVSNIAAKPAFPESCVNWYLGALCTNSVIAALNNARHVMGLPNYVLPAGFAVMPPAYQFLALSNADRVLAGRTPITAFNPTLNTVAQNAANASADPSGPGSVDGIPYVGWSANWAGGMSPLEAYYDWMYDDGFGSNNLDCNSPTDSGCWGHREDTLFDFGHAEVAMGVGTDSYGTSYGTSWTELYWAYSTTGSRIQRLPAVFSVSATGGPASGGTTVTLTGYGLETASKVMFANVGAAPLTRSARLITVRTPPRSGVVPVQVVGDGGTSVVDTAATFSYLAAPRPGSFVPLTPVRVLDTRSGNGAAKARVGRLQTVLVPVLGRGGVPRSGVSAVVLNVTAVGPAAAGYLTAYGSGAPRPGTSNLDYAKAQTIANLVIAPVGRDGRVALFNGSGGSLDLLSDVSGYYLAGTPSSAGSFTALAPVRLLDTRVGIGAPKARVSRTGTIKVTVAGRGKVPATGVSSVFVNVTVVNPAAPGYLTVYGDGSVRPGASNLNFDTNQTIPNLVLTPVGADGRIAIYNGSGATVDVLVDVVGYLRTGVANTAGAIVPVPPARTFDTRTGTGLTSAPPYDVAIQAGQKFVVPTGFQVPVLIAGRHGVPAHGVAAVVLNVTVVEPNAAGRYTAYPDGQPAPQASNVNFVGGQTIPNLVIVPVAENGLIDLYNGSPSYTSLVVDVAGYILG